MNIALTARLSLMMFVQYFIWGCWAPTLGNFMGTEAVNMGELIPVAYSLGPFCAIIAPFSFGMVADRFFDSEKVLGVFMPDRGCCHDRNARLCRDFIVPALVVSSRTVLFPISGIDGIAGFPPYDQPGKGISGSKGVWYYWMGSCRVLDREISDGRF